MKKSIVIFAFAILGFAGSAFAGTIAPKVPTPVSDQFGQQFTKATDVQWETGRDFYKATFEAWGRTLFAFYSGSGDLMGVATNLSAAGLSQRLKDQLHRQYNGYWITDLFGYHNVNEHGLVVTVENADRAVVLKAIGNGGWAVYRTTAKH
jgi:hypothetical protein